MRTVSPKSISGVSQIDRQISTTRPLRTTNCPGCSTCSGVITMILACKRIESMSSKLKGCFYEGAPRQVAKRLLGKLLVRQLADGTRLSGIVVEVEAYLSRNDPACHAHIGLRKRNASMFAAPGTLYVYSIHRRHCLNVVTEAIGCGSAILIRALEPLEGLTYMASLRGPTVAAANTEQRQRASWRALDQRARVGSAKHSRCGNRTRRGRSS